MKPGIHPEYKAARIVCACGNAIETRSTVEEIHVEICSSCHPFFTGRQKLIDTAGRVEKFRAKYGLSGETGVETEADTEEESAENVESAESAVEA